MIIITTAFESACARTVIISETLLVTISITGDFYYERLGFH